MKKKSQIMWQLVLFLLVAWICGSYGDVSDQIPFDHLVGGPIRAALHGQMQSFQKSLSIVESVSQKKLTISVGDNKTIDIPLLLMFPLPSLAVHELSVSYKLLLSTSNDGSMSGSISHQQTNEGLDRGTAFSMELDLTIREAPPSEGFNQLLDTISHQAAEVTATGPKSRKSSKL